MNIYFEEQLQMAAFEFAKNVFLENCFIFVSDSIHVNSIHVNA